MPYPNSQPKVPKLLDQNLMEVRAVFYNAERLE